MTATEPDLDYGTVGATLNKSVLFVGVYVHSWKGQYHIRNAMVKLGKVELADELVTNPRWNLLPTIWRKKFNVVENQAKRVIDNCSVKTTGTHFPLKGVHIVARTHYEDFATQLRQIEVKNLKPLADEFANRWTDILADINKEIGDESIFRELQAKLPKATAIRNKFWIETVVVPIKLDESGWETLTDSEAIEVGAAVKQRGREFTDRIAKAIVGGLQNELRNAVDTLTERIKDEGVLKEANLNAVREAFNKLKQFDFVMTHELDTQMQKAQELLNVNTCKDLNTDMKESASVVSKQLAAMLNSVRQQLDQDVTVERAFSRGRRVIRT